MPDDDGTVVPVAPNLDRLDEDGKKRLQAFADALVDWPPAKVEDLPQRVRNLLAACAVADVVQDPLEAEIPFVVFEHMRADFPPETLKKLVTYVVLHPEEGTAIVSIKELGVETESYEQAVRERTTLYGKKLLYRLLGKDKDKK